MKITPDQLRDVLQSKPVAAPTEELKELFTLLGFRLLELHRNDGLAVGRPSLCFEVHYRRTFVIRVSADDTRVISFSNQFVNFGDGCTGLSTPVDDIRGLILTIIGMFMHQMRITYDNQIAWTEESDYTQEELWAIVKTLNADLFTTHEG